MKDSLQQVLTSRWKKAPLFGGNSPISGTPSQRVSSQVLSFPLQLGYLSQKLAMQMCSDIDIKALRCELIAPVVVMLCTSLQV